jgi:hypothetical protein
MDKEMAQSMVINTIKRVCDSPKDWFVFLKEVTDTLKTQKQAWRDEIDQQIELEEQELLTKKALIDKRKAIKENYDKEKVK